MTKLNSSIGKKYKLVEVKEREFFSMGKFVSGFFAMFSPVGWAKDIVGLFNVRKLIVYALILGMIFGYGYWQGKINQNLLIDIGEYKDSYIKLLDDNVLHIDENGTVTIEDANGNILKTLKSKDLDALKKQLRPFGFELSPIGVIGIGGSTDGSLDGEGGIGIRWFRAWRINFESFLTNKGIYPLGISYKLDGIGLKNSSFGIGAGTSYDNFLADKRLLAYFGVKF